MPIVGYYNRQRFRQFDPSDTANWYMVPDDIGKKKIAMYPTMGRQHISFLGQNRLIFSQEPRAIYKSNDYWYAIVGDQIFRTDQFFNQVEVTSTIKLVTLNGNIFFAFLVAGDPAIAGNTTFACFADGQKMYVYNEDTELLSIVTDPSAPVNPLFLAAFGNRIVASGAGSSTFVLSVINLGGASFSASTCFTVSGAQVFAQETNVIRQMAVLQNTLYIFTDFTTGVWSNIVSQFVNPQTGVVTTFPWKKNSTYDWDYGLSDPNSLDVDFGMIVWLAKNRNGLIQIMMSTGQKPVPISSKAIDVLLQRIANVNQLNPFMTFLSDGFLYDYENTIFYRISAGVYSGTQLLDQVSTSNSIEFNFDTQTWHRCIELNGERNRNQDHVFFANRHLVTVEGDNTVYEMAGNFYTNEITNPLETNPQAADAYLQEPFRYERITPIIVAGLIEGLNPPGFYAEFITDYVEIDFVFGDRTFTNSSGAFENAQFIIDEQKGADGNPVYVIDEQGINNEPVYLIAEQGNFPTINSPTYNNWFKPHIELYFSDDGGISFLSADVREFSQVGQFQWRMRWYQLGPSRNRVYKLICVSPSPIVILGASMDVRNASGGAA